MRSTHLALTPDEPATVFFASDRSIGAVELIHIAGGTPVYFTLDDTPPEIAGDDTYVLTAAAPTRVPCPGNQAVVQLITAGHVDVAVIALFAHTPDDDLDQELQP